MTWHYAEGGAQHGPVDDAEFDRLIAAGVVTPETLVWRAGMAGWQPLREARGLQLHSPAVVQPAPAFASQAPPQPTIDPDAAYARIVAEDRRVRVIDSLRRGWDLVFADPGQSIGVSALVMLTIIGAGLIPCAGSIAQLIATGPLIGGWYLYFLKRIRGQPTEWGDAWAGFSSPMLTQLVLQYIVATVASFALMIPTMVAVFVLFFSTVAAASVDERLAPLALLPIVGLMLVTLAAFAYLTIAWIFALPLIIDKQLPFWPATKLSWRVANRQLLPLLGLLLLSGLVYLVGVLALCVGVLVALPICVAALAYTYEDLFGEPHQAMAEHVGRMEIDARA
ncbi:MAG: GYF domain-containing protein [Vicinamibacteraceae bacterium]